MIKRLLIAIYHKHNVFNQLFIKNTIYFEEIVGVGFYALNLPEAVNSDGVKTHFVSKISLEKISISNSWLTETNYMTRMIRGTPGVRSQNPRFLDVKTEKLDWYYRLETKKKDRNW